MNKLIRLATAGALLAGIATAQAQNLPSTGNSDLWLFVNDTNAAATFAVDTGISLSSLMPTASFVSGSVLNDTAFSAGGINFTSSQLASFVTTALGQGHTLQWAVEGIQYPSTTTGAGYKKPGGIVGAASASDTLSANVTNLDLSALQQWGLGLQGDLTYLLGSGYAAGGKSYLLSDGTSAGNVWGTSAGAVAGSTNLYAAGVGQDVGNSLNTTLDLYGLTGNAGTGQAQSYILTKNLKLDSTGRLSSVPLPAAVWLFGSGLLGLIGVGRRRSPAAV